MRVKYLHQDFDQRLNGGVVFYDGKPVSVYSAGNGLLQLHSFPEGDPTVLVKPDDTKLDISAPRLGYVNIGGKAVYVYRKPLRQYKQSLTVSALETWTPLSKRPTHAIGDFFGSKQFYEMLIGKYPNPAAALKFVSEKTSRSMAMGRNAALAKDSYGLIHVFYKTDEVGTIEDPTDPVVDVPSREMATIVSTYLDFGWRIK